MPQRFTQQIFRFSPTGLSIHPSKVFKGLARPHRSARSRNCPHCHRIVLKRTSSRGLPRFLSTFQIMRLYETYVTRAGPTQIPLQESAVSSLQIKKRYDGQSVIFQLAGILTERIILNHASQGGKKRIALLAADTFLKINGFQMQKKPLGRDDANNGLKDAHVATASNRWTAEDLAEFYRGIAKAVSK